MKKIIVALFGSALLAMSFPDLLTSIDLKEKIGTLYAVAGIMFSVGMSLIITTSVSKIRNEKYKNRIRSAYDDIRNLYIIEFLIVSVLYMFIDSGQEPLQWHIRSFSIRFSLPLLLGCNLIFSIIFFIINFTELQTLNRGIEESTGD